MYVICPKIYTDDKDFRLRKHPEQDDRQQIRPRVSTTKQIYTQNTKNYYLDYDQKKL